MATSCPLGQQCPLANQRNASGKCPLGKDCQNFPTGRLRGVLGDLNDYLGASTNSFSSDEDLIQSLTQLRANISLVLAKLNSI